MINKDQTGSILGAEYLRELNAEEKATRQCLENVPEGRSDWKPHERSMPLGYLAQLIADMPRWLKHMIEDNVIDFADYEQFKGETRDEFIAHFSRSMEGARRAIENLTDEDLTKEFTLRHGDQVLMKAPVGETISSTINHLVHHRGQLTVYLRLNDQKVPSTYGPSADTGGFEDLK